MRRLWLLLCLPLLCVLSCTPAQQAWSPGADLTPMRAGDRDTVSTNPAGSEPVLKSMAVESDPLRVRFEFTGGLPEAEVGYVSDARDCQTENLTARKGAFLQIRLAGLAEMGDIGALQSEEYSVLQTCSSDGLHIWVIDTRSFGPFAVFTDFLT